MGRNHIDAADGPLGLVRLSDVSCGNSLALRLLHDALGYAPDRVHKRAASSAVTAAIRVLDGSLPARDVTIRAAADVRPPELAAQPVSLDTSVPATASGTPVPRVCPAREHTGDVSQETPSIHATAARPGAVAKGLPDSSTETEVRRLTDEGLRRAREFLAYMREHPGANREPPRELLFGERYSRPFRESVRVERRPFRTRREAAEYFAPKLAPIRHLVTDDARLWSWLGMFYFADTVQVKDGEIRLSPLDERFVVDGGNSNSYRQRYRHYLWSAWRLSATHGESVAFLLDQELTSFPAIMQRALGSVFVFNSVGVIQTMLRLYTSNGKMKRGFREGYGGLAKFVLVLNQLERTYDVYGMSPGALINVLPAEFQRWDSQTAPRALEAAAPPEPAASAAEPSAAYADRPEPVGAEPAVPFRGKPPPVRSEPPPVRGEPVEPQAGGRPFGGLRAGSSTSSGRTGVAPPVRQTLLDVRAQIEQRGQVTWADPRDHIEEGSEAWKAYVAVCGVPERRLFRTAFLYRLDEVLASLD